MPFTIVLNFSCRACHAANVRLVDFTDPQVRRDSLASWTPGVALSTAESSGTVPKATSPAPPPHPLRSSQLPPVVRRLPQRSPEPRRVRPRLAFGPVDSVEATLQDETVAAVAASLPKTPTSPPPAEAAEAFSEFIDVFDTLNTGVDDLQ